jgi:DNA-binding MarR family transcriptional regulator
MFSRMTSSGYLTGQAARLFSTNLHDAFKPLGLAPAQFMVLIDLSDGQSRTQKELAGRLDVEQPTMANTLARMERDGLIARTVSQADKRIVTIHATPRALQIYGQAAKLAAGVNDRAVRGLTTEERLRFLGTMARIIENLKRQ